MGRRMQQILIKHPSFDFEFVGKSTLCLCARQRGIDCSSSQGLLAGNSQSLSLKCQPATTVLLSNREAPHAHVRRAMRNKHHINHLSASTGHAICCASLRFFPTCWRGRWGRSLDVSRLYLSRPKVSLRNDCKKSGKTKRLFHWSRYEAPVVD